MQDAIVERLACIQKLLERRDDIDHTVTFNLGKPIILDYKDRRYIFIFSPNTISLSLEEYGTLLVPANTWVNLNFYEGTRILLTTASGTSQQVLMRWTDYPLWLSQPLAVSQTLGGLPLTPTNAEPNISNIQQLILNGQGFVYTTGTQTSGGAGNTETCVFNPALSTKNILIYSVKAQCTSAGFGQMSFITADPALGTAITPVNMKAGSAIASVATAEFTNTTTGITGTIIDSFALPANTQIEVLSNAPFLFLPSGQAGINGIEVAVLTSTNKWGVTIRGVEY